MGFTDKNDLDDQELQDTYSELVNKAHGMSDKGMNLDEMDRFALSMELASLTAEICEYEDAIRDRGYFISAKTTVKITFEKETE